MLQNIFVSGYKVDIEKASQIKKRLETSSDVVHQQEVFTKSEDIIGQEDRQINILRKFAGNKSQLIEIQKDNRIDIVDFDETGNVKESKTYQDTASIKNEQSHKTLELRQDPSGKWELIEKDDISDAQITTTLYGGHVYKGKVEVPGKKKLTVLFWGNGSGNLEPLVVRKLLDLEKLGSTKDINIIAQISRSSQEEMKECCGEGYVASNIDGNWSNQARRYYVTKGVQEENPLPVITKETIDSPVLEKIENIDMTDKKQMLDFLIKETKEYPAEHYMIVLFDHGQGWKGIAPKGDERPSISPEDMGDITEKVKEAIGHKIDLMVMENCLEGQLESLYPMRNNADYIVASPEVLWGSAFTDNPGPIHLKDALEIIQKNEKNELNNPKEMATELLLATANKHHAITLTEIDSSKLDGLAEATEKLKETLTRADVKSEEIGSIVRQSQQYENLTVPEGRHGFVDLGDLVENIQKNIADPDVKNAANGVKEALGNAVVAKLKMTGDKLLCDSDDGSGWISFDSNVKKCQGLSINLGMPESDRERDFYNELSFNKKTGWNQVVEKLNWNPGEVKLEL